MKFMSGMMLGVSLLAAWNIALGAVADNISVENAYVRAVPPGQPNSAAFMVLSNQDATAHALVNAESSASKVVELHTHIHEGGMMMMRRIERIEIGANANTELKPGGLHVMLINLQQPLVPGDKVGITLEFEDGSKKEIQAPVQKIMMEMQHGSGQMPHDMH